MKIQKLENQLKQNTKTLQRLEEEKTIELQSSRKNQQKFIKTKQNKSKVNKFLGSERNERIERIELIETVLNNGNTNDILQLLETVDPSFILV